MTKTTTLYILLCIDVHQMYWIDGKIYTEAPVDSTVLLYVSKRQENKNRCRFVACKRANAKKKEFRMKLKIKYWWSLPFKRRTMILTIICFTVNFCQIKQSNISFHRVFFFSSCFNTQEWEKMRYNFVALLKFKWNIRKWWNSLRKITIDKDHASYFICNSHSDSDHGVSLYDTGPLLLVLWSHHNEMYQLHTSNIENEKSSLQPELFENAYRPHWQQFIHVFPLYLLLIYLLFMN